MSLLLEADHHQQAAKLIVAVVGEVSIVFTLVSRHGDSAKLARSDYFLFLVCSWIMLSSWKSIAGFRVVVELQLSLYWRVIAAHRSPVKTHILISPVYKLNGTNAAVSVVATTGLNIGGSMGRRKKPQKARVGSVQPPVNFKYRLHSISLLYPFWTIPRRENVNETRPNGEKFPRATFMLVVFQIKLKRRCKVSRCTRTIISGSDCTMHDGRHFCVRVIRVLNYQPSF